MRLGIYMGSFNPPHKGHIHVIKYLLKNNYVDKILFVPTLNYWNKNNLIDIEDRINMLRFYEDNQIMVDTKNNKYIYTYELMRVLKKEYPDTELIIIMGSDNAINLHKWKNFKELLNYKIIVMNRDDIMVKDYLNNLGSNFIVIDNYPYLDISSTKVRNNLSMKYLDKKVLDYINKHNLYNIKDDNISYKKILIDNINKIHTTTLGKERIRKNLKIVENDVIDILKNKILKKESRVNMEGKNYYCLIDNIKITINSYNYSVITAHIIE